jgi:hypothetical protein
MEIIKQAMETYTTKQEVLNYLEALKMSISFTIKITKQVMKGKK